jgi:GntR family transcriptional regulator
MDRRLRLLSLDPSDATPLYMQLARKLLAAVDAGQWIAGEALPSERTLTETLDISRVTARRALKVLEDEGAILKTRGVGSFLAPRFHQPLTTLHNFSGMVRPLGFTPKSELISFVRRKAIEEERSALNLKPQDGVVAISRLRKADDTVVALQISVLPLRAMQSDELINESLYEYLESLGLPILRAVQRHRAATADAGLADLLRVSEGDPLGLVIRTGFTKGDVPLEYTKTYCVNDFYDFVVELKRDQLITDEVGGIKSPLH